MIDLYVLPGSEHLDMFLNQHPTDKRKGIRGFGKPRLRTWKIHKEDLIRALHLGYEVERIGRWYAYVIMPQQKREEVTA